MEAGRIQLAKTSGTALVQATLLQTRAMLTWKTGLGAPEHAVDLGSAEVPPEKRLLLLTAATNELLLLRTKQINSLLT